MIRTVGAALVVAITIASPLQAQVPDSLIASGIRAYRDLDYETAAGLLTRAVTLLEPMADTARTAEALTYLGAIEVYRQRPASAQSTFRRLVRLAPAYRVDRLIFPPEVTSVFDAARRATPAVAVALEREQRFRTGAGVLRGMLFGSTFHEVRVELQRLDATVLRRLYAGPIADSLLVTWDGYIADGQPLPTGRYQVAIASLDADGNAARILRLPIDVTSSVQDTLALPAAPDAELLPERTSTSGNMESLLGGLLIGAAIAFLPSPVASDASLSGGRVVVGGAVAVTGVVGFFRGQTARPIPDNIAQNDSLRAAWRAERATVAAENARRRATADMLVQIGPAQVIDREGS